jgi:hypothetical protein
VIALYIIAEAFDLDSPIVSGGSSIEHNRRDEKRNLTAKRGN